MLDAIYAIVNESFALLARMGPYLLLGIAAAGVLHLLVPVEFVARHLGGTGPGSAFKAAALGVPLPLCSCGVVPVAASLKKSGASRGAVVSFLITTPTSGVDSILATYALLGGAITLARVMASFVIGLVAGVLTNLGVRVPAHRTAAERSEHDEHVETSAQAQQDAAQPLPSSSEQGQPRPRQNRLASAMAYGLGELFGGIARPLAIGTVLGGAIAYFLPAGLLEQYVGQGLLSYLVMLAVGIPLYVCASGSIPLAAALLAKGITPGAALVFLIAGPATNAATVTVIYQMLGKRPLVIYLLLLVLGSLAAGWATDAVFTQLPSVLPAIVHHGAHHTAGLSLLEIASGAALGLLIAYHLAKQAAARASSLFTKGEPDMATTTLKVDDMTCQHCARTITTAVSAVPGVQSVDANPATKLVRMVLDDDADATAITQAIAEAGFHPQPAGE